MFYGISGPYTVVVDNKIDHMPYIRETVSSQAPIKKRQQLGAGALVVDFRSAVGLPYDHRSVANTDTRFAPNILGRACFFPYGAQCGRRAR